MVREFDSNVVRTRSSDGARTDSEDFKKQQPRPRACTSLHPFCMVRPHAQRPGRPETPEPDVVGHVVQNALTDRLHAAPRVESPLVRPGHSSDSAADGVQRSSAPRAHLGASSSLPLGAYTLQHRLQQLPSSAEDSAASVGAASAFVSPLPRRTGSGLKSADSDDAGTPTSGKRAKLKVVRHTPALAKFGAIVGKGVYLFVFYLIFSSCSYRPALTT